MPFIRSVGPRALTLVLVTGFAGWFSPVQAAVEPGTIYEGTLSGDDLSWRVAADGTTTPVLAGCSELAETGKPVLAVKTVNLLVPIDEAITGVEVVPLATQEIALPGPLGEGGLLYDDRGEGIAVGRLASGPAGYPTVWGEFTGSHTRRGYRWISVLVYPLRAQRGDSGSWESLQLLERFAIRLRNDGRSELPDLAERQRLVPGERQRLEAELSRLCANPELLPGYRRQDGTAMAEPTGGFQPSRGPSLSGSAVRYLIITNEDMAAAFEALAEFKTGQGLPTVVKSIEWIEVNYRHGVDIQETIRMFIREAYQKWGLEYVLLGGDSDVIPARYAHSTYFPVGGSTDIPSDLYFACLDGNWDNDHDSLFGEAYIDELDPGDDCDLTDEVYVGRAPVSTPEQAAVFVDKVIQYEQTAAGSAWPNRNLFAAEVLFPPDYQPGYNISLDGAEFAEAIIDSYIVPCTTMESVRMYEAYPLWPGSVPLAREALIDTLNTGHYGIVNQIGHGFYFNMSVGDGNFIVPDADGLTNGDHTFLIYALNCASAAFDVSCLMDRFLQNGQGGAVAALGSTREAFPYTASKYQQEFFAQLYCENDSRAGVLQSLSREPYLADTYFSSSDRWTFLAYVLIGDPTLSLWSDTPASPQVSQPPALVVGPQEVPVAVNREGSPVPGAMVCLTMTGGDYAWGVTDGSGNASLTFVPTSPGTATLTVAGRDLALTRIDIPVALAGSAYIALADMSVVDNGSQGSIGNGNGVPEAGETVALLPDFQDTGGGGASGCTAVLRCSEPGFAVLDSTASLGNVSPGGSQAAQDPFLLEIAATVPDGTLAGCRIAVSDDQAGAYTSPWSLRALAPEVEPIALVWSDQLHGNGDGFVDSGERLTIRVRLKNFGAGRLDGLTARLRTLSPHVVIYDSVVTYPAMALQDTASASAALSLSYTFTTFPIWSWIVFQDGYGRTFRHDFRMHELSTPGGLRASGAEGPDVIAVTWDPSTDLELRGYHIYRSDASTGPFTRIDRDLLENIPYFRDEGLAFLTRYYYRVTAVDSSLIEGPPSDWIVQTTTPPELSGFPLPFGRETDSHIAVGDVNADGINDIVLASDEIYVWNALGQELFDGDNDAQTHGPITNLDSDFQPGGVALANLDGVPGLEIIASESAWTVGHANAVHVFRADGTELPGWPQMLRAVNNGWAWSTPAIGDVDGDGEPEIVINTLDGRTWVWHVDGTELLDGDSDPSTNGVFIARAGEDQEWGQSSPALFDLDGDGAKEIIFGTKDPVQANNFLHAYRYDQSEAPGFPYMTDMSTVTCSPTIADLNNDNVWEIIFMTRNDLLHVVEQDGSPYPGFPVFMDYETNATCPSQAVGNFDEDDDLEIVAIATHSLSSADIYVIDTDVQGGTSGQTLPGWPQSIPGASQASPVVGDIDGDGVMDIVHGIGSDSQSPNNLYAFKADGELIDGFPINLTGPIKSTPVLCDLDGNADVEIVVAGWDKLLHVWDLPAYYALGYMPWPTFRGHNLRDGVYRPMPGVAVPASTPPDRLTLRAPYPNPFNPVTTVQLYVPGPEGALVQVDLGVYDLQGRLVRQLRREPALSGWHDWIWDGRDEAGRSQASGLYFLRARSGDQTAVMKMSLIK